MTEHHMSSFAVIPSYILDDDDLDSGAKILFARISMYSNQGRCWASNDHFAEKEKTSVRTIQRYLKQLVDKKYIIVEVKTGGWQTERDIWLTNDFKKSYRGRHTCHPSPKPMSPPQEAYVTPSSSDIHYKINNSNKEDDDDDEGGEGVTQGQATKGGYPLKVTKLDREGNEFEARLEDYFSYVIRKKLPWSTQEIEKSWEKFCEVNCRIGDWMRYLDKLIETESIKTKKEEKECQSKKKSEKKRDFISVNDMKESPLAKFDSVLQSKIKSWNG